MKLTEVLISITGTEKSYIYLLTHKKCYKIEIDTLKKRWAKDLCDIRSIHEVEGCAFKIVYLMPTQPYSQASQHQYHINTKSITAIPATRGPLGP